VSADLDNSGLGNEELASAGESTLESAGSRTRLVEIRCGFAEMARKEADAADLRAREVRRAYDEGAALLAPLLAAVDPVVTKAPKEKAHAAFRSAVRGARVRNQVEAAASVWLAEINRINNQYRAAQARAKHEREAVDSLLSKADKLADTAESTSAMAAAAAEACRSAREDVDGLDKLVFDGPTTEPAAEPALEQAAEFAKSGAVETSAVGPAAAAAAAAPAVPSPPEGSALSPEAAIVPALAATFGRAPEPEEPTGKLKLDWLVIDLRSPQPQAIIRLLRRDDGIMTSLVEHLAGPDPGIHRFWQMLLSNFADSVEGAAIDDAWFEFPPGSPFWDIFTAEQAREVARGLSALGFRYDGFGAFADDRVPSQRDLALAVGAAGLLPARIRYWPKPEETAELYRNVRVAADAFVAARAPALTLGELVHLLGRRAHLLADLWNDWPRVRPLLFSTAY
jgi:hypothetical protein